MLLKQCDSKYLITSYESWNSERPREVRDEMFLCLSIKKWDNL